MFKGKADKKSMADGERDLHELFEAVLQLRGARECEKFFTDLCTPAELVAMADRWKVARLLDRGIPYREIYERTGVSTATVTRVARALVYGESGYRKMLDSFKKWARVPLAVIAFSLLSCPRARALGGARITEVPANGSVLGAPGSLGASLNASGLPGDLSVGGLDQLVDQPSVLVALPPTALDRAAPGWDGAGRLRRYGVEIEYRDSLHPYEIRPNGAPPESQDALARAIVEAVGPGDLTLRRTRYSKHGVNFETVFIADPGGEHIAEVNKELVDRFALLKRLHELGQQQKLEACFDGQEVATAVLEMGNEADAGRLVRMHEGVVKGGRFRRGIVTAFQTTYEMIPFINGDPADDNANISAAVDAMLKIENAWRAIYSIVNPVRTGSMVTQYAVPLAANQKELLYRLAAMPAEDRTIGNVRRLFEEFDEREHSLTGEDGNAAWKYRAMKYEFLGFRGKSRRPVMEFRPADFPTGTDLRRIPKLIQAIVSAPTRDGGPVRFEDPFRDLDPDPSFAEITESILSFPAGEFAAFLAHHGLSAEEFPQLGILRGHPAEINGVPLPSSRLRERDSPAARRLQVMETAVMQLIPAVLTLVPAPSGGYWRPEDAVLEILSVALRLPSLAARRFAALALFGQNDLRHLDRIYPLISQALADDDEGVRLTAESVERLLNSRMRRFISQGLTTPSASGNLPR